MVLNSRGAFNQHCYVDETGNHRARYKGLELSSVFQPIFDGRRRLIGLEALLRVFSTKTQKLIPPNLVLDTQKNDFIDCLNVDRLSRAIHLRNFATLNRTDITLFLNMLPISSEYNMQKAIDATLLLKRMQELGINTSRVVFELVETESMADELLTSATHYMQQVGFQVAIDDFGAGESNIKRLSLIKPDIIKVDRSLLQAFCQGRPASLIEVLQHARVLNVPVIIEGIETTKEFKQMQDLEIHYYQGFLLGKPQNLKDIFGN